MEEKSSTQIIEEVESLRQKLPSICLDRPKNPITDILKQARAAKPNPIEDIVHGDEQKISDSFQDLIQEEDGISKYVNDVSVEMAQEASKSIDHQVKIIKKKLKKRNQATSENTQIESAWNDLQSIEQSSTDTFHSTIQSKSEIAEQSIPREKNKIKKKLHSHANDQERKESSRKIDDIWADLNSTVYSR